MARKLVVCCDGTWNVPRQGTNVFRTYDFLRERLGRPAETRNAHRGTLECRGRSPKGDEVVLFYDEGVGARPETRYLEGFTGGGLSKNIIDAYEFLAENYQPGDEIYLFGFSRGAYTARSVCGFIGAAGLLRNADRDAIERAYLESYAVQGAIRAHAEAEGEMRRRILTAFGRVLDRLPGHGQTDRDVKIRFVGVYDTVGALGVPLSQAAIRRLNEPFVGFHDMKLGKAVEHAVHALAADECRKPYSPSLWAGSPGTALEAGQTLLQVWFPGVHSDVGGGYPDRGIGDHTWGFMMGEAAKRGLVLDDQHRVPELALRDLPPQHDSIDARWRAIARDIHLENDLVGQRPIGRETIDADGTTLEVLGDVRIHWTLLDRIGKEVDVITDDATSRLAYAGANLARDAGGAPLLGTLQRAVAAAVGAVGA